jgi:hypothetical protein
MGDVQIGFQSAHDLAKEIERLQKEREGNQTQLLRDHGIALEELKESMILVVERTKDLPELVKRVSRLEQWKVFIGGIAASFTSIGAIIGWLISFLSKRM